MEDTLSGKGYRATVIPDEPQAPEKPKRQGMWIIPFGVAAIALVIISTMMTPPQKPQGESQTADQAAQPAPTPTPNPAQATPAPPRQAQAYQAAPAYPNQAIAPTQAQPYQAAPQVPSYFARLNTPGVAPNFRLGPSISSPVIGSLVNGDPVEVLNRPPVIQDGIAWVCVRAVVGGQWREGWIAQNFITGGSISNGY